MKLIIKKTLFSIIVASSCFSNQSLSSNIEFDTPISFSDRLNPSWEITQKLPNKMAMEMLTIDYINNPFEKACPNGFVLRSLGSIDTIEKLEPIKQLTYTKLYCLISDKDSSAFVTSAYLEIDKPIEFEYIITNIDLQSDKTQNGIKPTLLAKGSIATHSGKNENNDLFSSYSVFEFSKHVLSYTPELKDIMNKGLKAEETKHETKRTWQSIESNN